MRKKLYSLLGDLPDKNLPIKYKKIALDENDDFFTEHLILSLNGIQDVPAIFTYPKHKKPPYPVILFSHSHGGLYWMGKQELLLPAPYGHKTPYAKALSDMGIAALAIDHWCFGERKGRTESATYKSMIWKGQVMWGMMVYDSLRAVDYLATREDIDNTRIGTTGISMGSTMSIWVTALDERIKTCAEACCLTDFEELEISNSLDEHGIYYYVPSLQKHFTMADICKLIAPRSHFATAGIYDSLTPIKGLEKINKCNIKGFSLKTYPCGHLETREMREDLLLFIKKTL